MTEICTHDSCMQEFGILNHRYECTECGDNFCDDHACNSSYLEHFKVLDKPIINKVIDKNGYLCMSCFEKSGMDLDVYQRSVFERKCAHDGCENELNSIWTMKQSCKVCGNLVCSTHSVDLDAEKLVNASFPEGEIVCHTCADLLADFTNKEEIDVLSEKKNADFYQKIRSKLKKWAACEDGKSNKWVEYLVAAPDLFHLLCKLAGDANIKGGDKAKVLGAIAYFVMPIDLLPEMFLGPIGYLDDISMAVYVLNSIVNNGYEEQVKKHWAGEGDVLELIQQITAKADEMVGSGMLSKLAGWLTKKSS